MNADQEKKLDSIHELLAGTLEKKGLVHKVDEMEATVFQLKKYKERDERFKNTVAGGVAVGTPLLVVAWHWIVKNIFHL